MPAAPQESSCSQTGILWSGTGAEQQDGWPVVTSGGGWRGGGGSINTWLRAINWPCGVPATLGRENAWSIHPQLRNRARPTSVTKILPASARGLTIQDS